MHENANKEIANLYWEYFNIETESVIKCRNTFGKIRTIQMTEKYVKW